MGTRLRMGRSRLPTIARWRKRAIRRSIRNFAIASVWRSATRVDIRTRARDREDLTGAPREWPVESAEGSRDLSRGAVGRSTSSTILRIPRQERAKSRSPRAYIERRNHGESAKKSPEVAPHEVRLRCAYFITCNGVSRIRDGREYELARLRPATRGGDHMTAVK